MKKYFCYACAIAYYLPAAWVAYAGYGVLDLKDAPGASVIMFFALLMAIASFSGTATILQRLGDQP